MLATLRLGWRNIWRNRRRTLISISAIGFGLALVILMGGTIGAMMNEAANDLDTAGMGHVEISAKGWRLHRQATELIANADAVRATLALPEGAQVGARVILRGLISSAHGGQGVEVHGVDWKDEAQLSEYVRTVRQGALPTGDDLKGVLIGEKLAEQLKVTVGSKVRLMVQRSDGEMGAELLRVRGIYHSAAAALSHRRVLVSRAAAQDLMGTPGAAHAIIIQLAHAADARPLADRLRATLGPGFDVLTYADIFPMFTVLEGYLSKVIVATSFFVYLLVGLGIFNTILMSVLERTREFGVMQALGTRPSGILAVVLAESFWTATVAVLAGVAVGGWVTWHFQQTALMDYSQMGEAIDMGGVTVRSTFKTLFSLPDVLRASASVYLMALLVGLYPAWKVAKLRPVQALHSK